MIMALIGQPLSLYSRLMVNGMHTTYCKQSHYVAYTQYCLNFLLIKCLISVMLWFYHANELREENSMPAVYTRLAFWDRLSQTHLTLLAIEFSQVLFQVDKTTIKTPVLPG